MHGQGSFFGSSFPCDRRDRRWPVLSASSPPHRRQRSERGSVGGVAATNGRRDACSPGWGSPFPAHRGSCRPDPRPRRRNAGHHADRVAGAARRTRGRRRPRHAVAVLRSASDHRQKKTAHAAEQDRPDILKRREEWFDGQIDLDPNRLVFIDETWASTNMARKCGRAPKGQRLRVGIPHGHWKTTTFVAGLRLTGMVAPMVIDKPINRSSFQAYVD